MLETLEKDVPERKNSEGTNFGHPDNRFCMQKGRDVGKRKITSLPFYIQNVHRGAFC